jgi:hypothetical protein
MAATMKRRWRFADDRRLMQLAASARSLDEIAAQMNRPPLSVEKRAMRLGVALKAAGSAEGEGEMTRGRQR